MAPENTEEDISDLTYLGEQPLLHKFQTRDSNPIVNVLRDAEKNYALYVGENETGRTIAKCVLFGVGAAFAYLLYRATRPSKGDNLDVASTVCEDQTPYEGEHQIYRNEPES